MCFLNRYIIEISGRLALVRNIELNPYSCNFTPILAYLVTLVFFSTFCSLEQTIAESLAKQLCFACWSYYEQLILSVPNIMLMILYLKLFPKGVGNTGEMELSSVLYWILFAFMLHDGFFIVLSKKMWSSIWCITFVLLLKIFPQFDSWIS